MKLMNVSRDSFRKIGLTFEEKAFYDILIGLKESHNFEYGEDNFVDDVLVNEKCKMLAKKVKEIIDTKSSFADWLNNQNIRNQLKLDIKICLVKMATRLSIVRRCLGKLWSRWRILRNIVVRMLFCDL